MSLRASASLPFELLRSHVLRRAHHRAFRGQHGGESLLGGPGLWHRLRQPEVEHLHAIPRQHDVLRLDVAMGDSGAMRAVERVGDLGGELERLIERERALLDAGGQRLALQVLHHHVAGAILIADVVECADVRMIQRCDGAGFAFEAGAQILALGDVFRQDLDGDGAVEPRVAGLVHFAHSSSADRGEDFVGAEFFAGGERHIRDPAQFIPLKVNSTWITRYPEVSASMAIPHAIRKRDKSETYQLSTPTEVHNCVHSRV